MGEKFLRGLFLAFKINAVIFFALLLYVFASKIYAKHLFRCLQKNQITYLYELNKNSVNAALYIKNIKDSGALAKYYVDQGMNIQDVIPFDINYMPLSGGAYITNRYGIDSSIIEVVSFDTICWGYYKSYVYKTSSHSTRAPDSSIEQAFKAIYTKDDASSDKLYKKISPYGFWCN